MLNETSFLCWNPRSDGTEITNTAQKSLEEEPKNETEKEESKGEHELRTPKSSSD